MEEPEFDRFADEYHSIHASNIRLSGEDPSYFARYKAVDAARFTGRALPVPAILDYGTGVGNSIEHLHRQFSGHRLVGLDVSRRSLEIATMRFGSLAEFRAFDGHRIPWPAGEFGMVFAACVFHHIDPADHVRNLREIRRVLAPDGSLILYEHNPLNPVTARAVRDCPFDENAVLIKAATMRQRALDAGFVRVSTHYRVFFPRSLAWMRPLEGWLRWLPLGAQYCLVCRR